MADFEQVKSLVGRVLGIGDRVNDWHNSTRLLGSLPEFDSMAVVSLITELEEVYGFVVEDDEITADTFETLGTLHSFVREKMA